MWKGIIIGSLPVVVIGLVASFVSQPKNGSVEWHKREYLAARKRLFNDTSIDRMRSVYHRVTKTPYIRRGYGHPESKELMRRVHENWQALKALGYLKRHEFSLIHQPKSRVHLLQEAALTQFAPDTVWSVGTSYELENILVVHATDADLAKWRDLVGRLDVPERTDAEVRAALIRRNDD